MDILNPLKGITPRFTEDQLTEILEWFDTNSKALLIIEEGEPLVNVVTVEKLMDFLALKKFHRRSFKYPTYDEIMRAVEKLKMATYRMLTRDQFVYILDRWVMVPTLKHELLLAFKAFDTEKRSFLDIEELKKIVTSYADFFNEDETKEMIRDANVRGDGNIYYEDFIESMLSISPELNYIQTDYIYEDPDEDPSVPPEPVIVEEEAPPQPPPPPPPPPAPKKGKGKK